MTAGWVAAGTGVGMSVWFVTGASRGLGLEIGRAALDRGHQVVAAARDPYAVSEVLPAAMTVALDVTDERQIREAVATAVQSFGRIDVLVNNAGRGLLGAIEETSDAEVRALFDTNVFGLLAVTRAVLPTMRAQGSGHIINIGSIGGVITGAGSGLYGATKFAVEGISEALQAELAPLGIAVTVVEPGAFRTDFLAPAGIRTAATIDDYAGTAGAVVATMDARSGSQPGDPAKAARAIVDLAGSAEPPFRLQLGPDSVARVEAKLAQVAMELDIYRDVALATDYD